MNYLVTGATGFIGQHLVRRLLKERKSTIYCLVRNVDKLPPHVRDRVRVVQGDGSTLLQHSAVIRACDVIFHCAAKADLGDSNAYHRDNVEFTELLVRIAESSKRLKRFVFTSTIGAMDRTNDDPCTAPLTEESTPHPLSEYGKSKLACERLLEASTMPYVILRPVLVYGPGMRRQSHLRVFIDAVERRKLFARFNFPGKVSLLHVDDLVQALMLVARHPRAVRQTFFAADDEPVSLGDIFQQLGSILGRKTATLTLNFGLPRILRSLRSVLPLRVQNLFSDVLCASNSKLRALGFEAKKDRLTGFLEIAHDHFVREHGPRGTAVVTGGASGIGQALSEQLYAHGYNVVVADRNRARGMQVAHRIRATFLPVDLATDGGVRRVAGFIKRNIDRISLLVNNAGVGVRGNTEEITSSKHRATLLVNCVAPVDLTNAALPLFIERGWGTIVNVGSSAGYQPLPYMSVYAASKAFVIRYTQAVQGELQGRGVSRRVEVILASPSGTATNFQQSAGVRGDDAATLLRPEEVAAAILRRIGKGSGTIIIGMSGKGMAFTARLLPTAWQARLWERLMRTMR